MDDETWFALIVNSNFVDENNNIVLPIEQQNNNEPEVIILTASEAVNLFPNATLIPAQNQHTLNEQ